MSQGEAALAEGFPGQDSLFIATDTLSASLFALPLSQSMKVGVLFFFVDYCEICIDSFSVCLAPPSYDCILLPRNENVLLGIRHVFQFLVDFVSGSS
jgi:hypothetical protein